MSAPVFPGPIYFGEMWFQGINTLLAALRRVPYFEAWSFVYKKSRVWWPDRSKFRIVYDRHDEVGQSPMLVLETVRTEALAGPMRCSWIFRGHQMLPTDVTVFADNRPPPAGDALIFDSHALTQETHEVLRAKDLVNLLAIGSQARFSVVTAAMEIKRWLLLNRVGLSADSDSRVDPTSLVLAAQKTTLPNLPAKLEQLDPAKETAYYQRFHLPEYPAPHPREHPVKTLIAEKWQAMNKRAMASALEEKSPPPPPPRKRGPYKKRKEAPPNGVPMPASPPKIPRSERHQFTTSTKFLTLPTTKPRRDWVDEAFDRIEDDDTDGGPANMDA